MHSLYIKMFIPIIVLFTLIGNYSFTESISKYSEATLLVQLNKELSNEQIEQIGEEIKKIPEVTNIEYESPEDALLKVKSKHPNLQKLIAAWEADNPFRPTYIITIKYKKDVSQVYEKIEAIPGVYDIKNHSSI